MSESESDGYHPVNRNESWLHSDSARSALAPNRVGPVRVAEEATRDIRDSVRRVLEEAYSSDSSSEPEILFEQDSDIVVERVFPPENATASLNRHNETEPENNQVRENGPEDNRESDNGLEENNERALDVISL